MHTYYITYMGAIMQAKMEEVLLSAIEVCVALYIRWFQVQCSWRENVHVRSWGAESMILGMRRPTPGPSHAWEGRKI